MTEEQQIMVDDCMNRDTKLTDWEAQFIDSINNQEYPLTENQVDRLGKIWERVT